MTPKISASESTASDLTFLPADGVATVAFAVPALLAVRFQLEADELLARLLAEATSSDFDLATWDSSAVSPPFGVNHRGDDDAWTLPKLKMSDVKVACWVVDNWTDTGRRLAAGLLTHPEGIRTSDLADLAGFTGGISSAMRHVAGRLRSIDRAPFWFGDPASKGHVRGQRLWIDTQGEPYELMHSILDARYPDILAAASQSGL